MNAEYFDIVIIGAGLSGIGAAYHFKKHCPQKSILILEGRQAMGGTWDLFRYPGIRSDSDMYTLGYNFKPWTNDKAIADGESIRDYIRDTAIENGIDKKIQYGQKVVKAEWQTPRSCWQLTVKNSADNSERVIDCNFVMSCTGYYNYEQGYRPTFNGEENFTGDIIHPQQWPENYDYSGKKVVVIGSGATAVTLVPSMADKAEHVTMLQRSPTYVMSLPLRDSMLNGLRKRFSDMAVYRFARSRNIFMGLLFYNYTRLFPKSAKNLILSLTSKQLSNRSDLSHFTPKYNPWDERLCAVPNGDLFAEIRKGSVSVVTDQIDCFTEDGIQLKSQQKLDADIIVTATGLDVQLFGGIELLKDGEPINITEKMCYRGVLFEGIPNLGMVFGYTNASWTLKADLISEYVCRLINYMDKNGRKVCTPINNDPSVEHEPFLDLQSGYIQRAINKVPKQGSKLPWKLYQNYLFDLISLRFGKLRPSEIEFS